MKKSTYFKNILRDIRDTKGKIISIFTMIFLASSVIVGLVLTGMSMRSTLDLTLKKYNHPDLTLTSTYGLNNEDQVIIERDKDIDHVYYSKIYDGFVDENLIRIKSYTEDAPKIKLVKGRLPEKDDEIVLDNRLKKDYKIGDKIKIKPTADEEISDSLKNSSYKVVGYVKSSEYLFWDIRDMSNTGKKMTDGFALVKEDNFVKDTLGQANIYYKKTKDMDKVSDDYMTYVKDKKKNLEEALENRPEEALKEIKEDAEKEIDKSEEKLDESEKKLNDKEKELDEAKKSLDQGFKDYEKAKNDFAYQISTGEEKLRSSKVKLDEGKDQFNDGKASYEKSKASFNQEIKAGQDKIDKGKIKLSQGQKDLDKAKMEYQENLDKLDQGFSKDKNQLDLLGQNLDKEKEELYLRKLVLEEDIKNLEELNSELESYDPTSDEYLNTLKQIEDLKSDIEKEKSDLEVKTLALKEMSYKYEEGKKQYELAYNEAKKPLDKAEKEIAYNEKVLDDKRKELSQGQKDLDYNKKIGQDKLNKAKNELVYQEEKLREGQRQYEQGQIELTSKKKEGEEKLKASYGELLDKLDLYNEGKKEFDDKEKDAREEIAEGKEEIKDQKDKLIRLKKPVYEVGHNRDNQAIKTYYTNSLNIDELSKVFPTFFYFVAILVTLTTMKRYIEEQRTQVGTLKSLGYTDKDIANKFYIYGLIPTLLGAIFGSIFGKYVLTRIIFKAYSTSFDVIDLNYANSLPIFLLTIILSMFLIYITIYSTNRKSVNEVPANLLRGKAPKKGSRIFLERVDFIWKKLSFMKKVTLRNIFRYKSRMYMTLFGVAGCTALLFFGFAMLDAIEDTSTIQRDQITYYDAVVIYDNEADEDELNSYRSSLDKFKSTNIIYQQGEVDIDDNKMDVNLMAFEDPKSVKDFINIRDLKKNPLKIEKSGAIISDNIAKKNKLKEGDELVFEDEDKEKHKLKINAIAENYLDDYIYISKDEYKKVFDKDASYNANLIISDDEDTINDLEKEDVVFTIIKPNSMYQTMDVLMSNLNLVIAIITLVSSILAIVVLFNLTNINVSERMRELATTKVLGFYPRETTAYIYRETWILTVIAVILGYGLGYQMFRYVLSVVAPEGILIAYRPHPKSFIIAALITFLISLVIMLVVHRRLKAIDMAEAMKSGE